MLDSWSRCASLSRWFDLTQVAQKSICVPGWRLSSMRSSNPAPFIVVGKSETDTDGRRIMRFVIRSFLAPVFSPSLFFRFLPRICPFLGVFGFHVYAQLYPFRDRPG